MDNYHITKGLLKWEFKKEGSTTVLLSSLTKDDLISAVSAYMQGKTGSVKIHKEDGKIQEERTYPRAADPIRSRG
ncbi:DUF2188 domain-containing protein [Aeromonas hydrophila]|uniref:DUF2188 domain-containing protein n=1 Tax=Aeromonas hydrophila TaxID=644 RepID=UPI000575B670|nr:DUF2188 domain-containing protein [Aeromonas hydrophila]KHN50216.1 hypothetical protein OI72_20715 [Aeromonas hydrophila]OFC44094.1 hypothetical protein BA189_19960 [Aeromonas hydrophila]OFC52812.1 hypothetical protein BA188_10175 [Aeromonas hydrophila]